MLKIYLLERIKKKRLKGKDNEKPFIYTNWVDAFFF